MKGAADIRALGNRLDWERLNSSHMLLLSLRWYVRRLVSNQWTHPGRAQTQWRTGINARWKLHMKAARRVLGLVARRDGSYWLSCSYKWSLRCRIELDLDDMTTRREFENLPDSFPLEDEHTARFLEKHPRLVERTKEWLERPREKKRRRETKDVGMRRINARARGYLSELLAEED